LFGASLLLLIFVVCFLGNDILNFIKNNYFEIKKFLYKWGYKILGFIADNYSGIKILLYKASFALSGIFIVGFLIIKKYISRVEISNHHFKKYVGEASYFYKEYFKSYKSSNNKYDELKLGIKKNLRFLYSTWFYVFFCTAIISVISIYQCRNEESFKKMINDKKIEQLMLKCSFSITADVEKENADYEKKQDIVTSKDSLRFPLLMKINCIDSFPPIIDSFPILTYSCLISDTLTINFVGYQAKDTLTIKKDKNTNNWIIKDYPLKDIDTVTVKFVNFVPKKNDTVFTILKKTNTNNWKIKGKNGAVNFVVPQTYKGTYTFIIDSLGIEFECKISREKNPKYKGIKYRAEEDIGKNGSIIKEDNNEYIHKIVRSYPIETFIYQKFFDRYPLSPDNINKLIEKIEIRNEIKKLIEKEKLELKERTEITNWYSTVIAILSLFANVLLLLFFGFSNTKTDMFSRKENKSDVYVMYRTFVIGIFFVIFLILLLNALYPRYSNYSPIFSTSFLFVINLIIALTSVVAIFGWWGSMNSAYTSFPASFKLLMVLYAMTHFFELNIQYKDAFNEVAELILYIVAIFAKVYIIFILLVWAPINKRILWFIFTGVNNYRTTEDYEDFAKIFDILELKQENKELKSKPKDLNLDKTLLELKQENVKLKREYADVKSDHRIIKKIKNYKT